MAPKNAPVGPSEARSASTPDRHLPKRELSWEFPEFVDGSSPPRAAEARDRKWESWRWPSEQ